MNEGMEDTRTLTQYVIIFPKWASLSQLDLGCWSSFNLKKERVSCQDSFQEYVLWVEAGKTLWPGDGEFSLGRPSLLSRPCFSEAGLWPR